MPRLVLVTSRVAFPGDAPAIGTADALRGALRESGGLWIGFSGRSTRDGTRPVHEEHHAGVDYVAMDLGDEEARGFEAGFCQRTLWPTLHYSLDRVEYGLDSHARYRAANALLAEVVARRLRPDDVIWVHEHPLLPLAAELRARGVHNRIGLFLHAPFPPSDIARALPNHRAVFGAMAAFDVVGFQTRRDLANFRDYLDEARQAGELPIDGGDPACHASATSVDVDAVAAEAAAAMESTPLRRLRASLGDGALAIGIDVLDPSKGLREKFQAFQAFLRARGDAARPLTLLQIAPAPPGGMRGERGLRQELERIAGHVNGAYADPHWQPIRYVGRTAPRATLLGYMRAARIGLVTPLREGMNLVAKSYVAAQDPDAPGVLVLSRFAGAASSIEGALLVNPHDAAGVAAALAEAMDMDPLERRERHAAALAALRAHDARAWVRDCLDALDRDVHGGATEAAPS
jgi:trehalose 6-phosphate synthase